MKRGQQAHKPERSALTPTLTLQTIFCTPTEHPLSSLPLTALFLDRLMKRRQESGYLIEEIGDVLLARVRVPSLTPSPSPSQGPGIQSPWVLL